MNDLKCIGTSIVFQEVPNEISLVFSISGCPYRCPDCHSKYLWKNEGQLLSNFFYKQFNKYKDYITCVCFMEGSQNLPELECYCHYIHLEKKKICLYTGSELNERLRLFALNNLNFLKVGPYRKNFGGLDSPTTNQKFFKIENQLVDITKIFQKSKSYK